MSSIVNVPAKIYSLRSGRQAVIAPMQLAPSGWLSWNPLRFGALYGELWDNARLRNRCTIMGFLTVPESNADWYGLVHVFAARLGELEQAFGMYDGLTGPVVKTFERMSLAADLFAAAAPSATDAHDEAGDSDRVNGINLSVALQFAIDD